jgi:5-methylcytosine-specific restriction protein B
LQLQTRKKVIPENITKEHLLKAIEEIDKEGIRKGRQSSTYDLIYKRKSYPPKLVLSLANKFPNGEELDHNSFLGGQDTPAFKVLQEAGFDIKKKTIMGLNIKEFVQVANEQKTGEGTLDSAKQYVRKNKGIYNELNEEISFGVGRASAIPWIAFTGFNQTVKDGIYPVYLYYKNYDLLILAYGLSETNSPAISWTSKDAKQTIKSYFENKYSKKPERYGSSYIYRTYDINNLPSEDVLESDLESIVNLYKEQFENKLLSKVIYKVSDLVKQIPFDLEKYLNFTSKTNLKFQERLIQRFLSSIATKPFVLLSGLSGSGKTKLAEAFAKWICQDKSQYKLVPVGADWTNREPLLGFPNALSEGEYTHPDNGVLKLIIEANKNADRPYFLILDEMNLSHVERYFADFLSTMESSDAEIQLHDSDAIADETKDDFVPKTIKLPKNLFIIGTVNIDETTYMFSPKVLDRANTIEFRVTDDEISSFFDSPKDIDLKLLETEGANMATSFLELSQKSSEKADAELVKDELVAFFRELQKLGAEFGYRTANEAVKLTARLGDFGVDDKNTKIDIAIMQKLLPKLSGSRRKLSKVLETLGKLCMKEVTYDVKKGIFDNEDFVFPQTDEEKRESNINYLLSLEKITRMYHNARDNGFASYAEA